MFLRRQTIVYVPPGGKNMFFYTRLHDIMIIIVKETFFIAMVIVMKALMKQMENTDVDLNAPNDEGDAPIHAIVRHKRRKRADLLLTLLVDGCSRIDVNRRTKFSGDTALHLAVMVGWIHVHV